MEEEQGNQGASASRPGSREPSPSVSAASGFDPSRDRLHRLWAAEKAEVEQLRSCIPPGHKCGTINVAQDQWEEGQRLGDAVKDARAELMPTEQDAIKVMWEGFQRLRELGWREAMYCPKDGSEFDVIEPGSTGIHRCHYSGEWPDGYWWIAEAGDLWPSHPILYRPTAEELAADEERRKRIRALRDSDGSRNGRDREDGLDAKRDSAGRRHRPEPTPGKPLKER